MSARHAAAYARAGWPVFPLWPVRDGRCTCSRPGCSNPAKHPIGPSWQKTIASVPAAEAAWRGTLAERGIGLVCGDRVGLWALDVDRQHGGLDALTQLEASYGPLPQSWRVRTGGGGLHIYFEWPRGGAAITNSDQGLPDGINVRGRGGFTVLPPTQHATGRPYQWIAPPRSGPVAPAPGWLLELVRRPKRSASANADADPAALIPAGKRYPALVRFCGLLRSAGLSEEAVVDCGLVFLRCHCVKDPPMDLEHAKREMRDIARRYPPEVNR